MKKFSISTAVLFASLFFSVQNLLACTCAALETAEAFENAEAVFVGTVESEETVFHSNATFNVEQSWKPVESNQITVYNIKGCEIPFSDGYRYLVYANENNGRLYTGICERSIRLLTDKDAEQDLKFLQAKANHFIPETKLLSFGNLKIVLFITTFILVFLLAWFLLDKFGYV